MRFIRILVALSLPYLAWQLHHKAIATTDAAIDAPRTLDNPLPEDRAGDFFGEDPRVAAKTPKGKSLLFTAQLIDLAALGCLLASPLFLVSVFIRRRPQQEQEPCAPVEPS